MGDSYYATMQNLDEERSLRDARYKYAKTLLRKIERRCAVMESVIPVELDPLLVEAREFLEHNKPEDEDGT